MKNLRKIFAFLIVASMLFTSNASFVLADTNNETNNEVIDETFDENIEETTTKAIKDEVLLGAEAETEDETEIVEEDVVDEDFNEGFNEDYDEDFEDEEESTIFEPVADDEEIVDDFEYEEEPEEDEIETTEVVEESIEEVEEENNTESLEEILEQETETEELAKYAEEPEDETEEEIEEESEKESKKESKIEEQLELELNTNVEEPLYGAQELSSFIINEYTVTDYDLGDHYNPSGLIVTPYYKEAGSGAGSGSPAAQVKYSEQPERFSFRPDYVNSETFTTRGEVNMEIIFTDTEGRSKGHSTTLTVGTITNVNITTSPKTNYKVGEDFDPTGLVVTATWKNGETEEVSYATKPSNFMAYSNTTNLQESNTYVEYIVKVIEGIDWPVRIPITVTDKSVTSFTIGTEPTKNNYDVGETFDPTGLVANVTYDDGSNGTLSYASDASKFSFDPSLTTALTTTHTQVKVSIGSLSQNIPITVTKAIDSISVKSSNTTTIAISDDFSRFSTPFISNSERFDPNGMVIKVTYNDGSTAEVTYNNTTASQFTITYNAASVDIVYGGKSVRYEFSVVSEPNFYIYFFDSSNIKRARGIYDSSFVSKIEDLYNYVSGGRELGFYVINATGLQDAYNNYNANSTATMTLAEAMAEAQNITSVSPMTQYTFWGVTNRNKSQSNSNTGSSSSSGSNSDSGEVSPTNGPMGDLTKNPEYQNKILINETNNIPQNEVIKNDELVRTLASYPENANRNRSNAEDIHGNRGYGQWMRIPNTTTWFFYSGDITFNQGNSTQGFLANGWYNLNWDGIDKWYRFDRSGVMQLGWHQENGKLYFFQNDFSDNWYGKSVTGTQNIGGVVYHFDSTGALIQ